MIYWYAKVGAMSVTVIVKQRARINGTFMHRGKYVIGKGPQIKSIAHRKPEPVGSRAAEGQRMKEIGRPKFCGPEEHGRRNFSSPPLHYGPRKTKP